MWVGLSRAVRTPSRGDHDSNAAIGAVGPDSLFAGAPEAVVTLLGSDREEAEDLLVIDAGLRTQLGRSGFLDAALFYYEYDDVTTQEPGVPYTIDEPGLPHLIVPVQNDNLASGTARGVEIGSLIRDTFPYPISRVGLTPPHEGDSMTDHWGYSQTDLKHYTCYRANGPIVIDGRLDDEAWKLAPPSPRFEDLETPGRPALLDTWAKLLWDDDYLYVGFWCAEPHLRGTQTERDCMICQENDVEVFIAGENAYFEFELNSLGTIMERFYIWQDSYVKGGYDQLAEFDLLAPGIVDTLGGTWSGHAHPRGRRWCFRNWDMPGLMWAVDLQGTLNDDTDVDVGWSAEISFPWTGLTHLADGRSLPPRQDDVWRMDLSRFQWMEEDGRRICPGWAFNSHDVYDSHIPEKFTYIHMSEQEVSTATAMQAVIEEAGE